MSERDADERAGPGPAGSMAPPAASTPDIDVGVAIGRLLRDQPYGVLCTQGEEQAYGSLVAFAASADLGSILFATPSTTRKYRLLTRSPRVAFVVDDRTRFADDDFMQVQAVTATGIAREVERSDGNLDVAARPLLERHPYLASLLGSPTGALVRIEVAQYVHAARLQTVRSWQPRRAP